MSEISTDRRPEALGDPNHIEWDRLLEAAMTMPGALGATYSRFYQYSFMNQIALFMQGVTGPVATYKRWKDMDRQVLKGSKAKAILRPLMFNEINDKGEKEQKVGGFKWQNSVFEASDTEGADLPEYQPPAWDRTLALGTLGIQQVAFEQLNGNIQGFSRDREVAINPVAVYPFKTLIHEIGHVVLKHTTPEGLEEYRSHRGLMEFQAEGTAYLAMNELDALDQFNAAESRGYITHWLKGEKPDAKAIRQVFTATDTILKAGRSKPEENE
jgi:hypothetical protein